MAKRMTVVVDDEELYTALKVEAARNGQSAKDIVVQAVREWLEAKRTMSFEPTLGRRARSGIAKAAASPASSSRRSTPALRSRFRIWSKFMPPA